MVNYNEDDWNFSGGGIEEGETAEEAVLRELGEELGTHKFKVLKQSKELVQYDWPISTIALRFKEKGSTYKGQTVNYFLVEFTGDKIDLKPDPVELKNMKWVRYEELRDHFNFPHQWKTTKGILEEFKHFNQPLLT